jgi:hypothetical protein
MASKISSAGGQVSSGRRAVPVVRALDVALPPGESERLSAIAAKILRNEPSLSRTDMFGPSVFAGLTEAPALLLGDQREIGLHHALPEQTLEHRIALLAGAGDWLALERDCPAYERYVAGLLGLGGLQVIALGPPPPGRAIAVANRCREAAPILGRLVAAARDAGSFQLIPHIGAGSAWTLAGAIGTEAGGRVAVAAAPPRLTRRVNDKIWFANRVREVLGPEALPPTFAAFGPAAVAAKIARIARQAEKVIVKTPDSAGSMGNVAIDSALIGQMGLKRLRDLVLAMLRGRGWTGRFPLLIGVWEVSARASPSVQLWIPSPGQGGPVIEGLFEQRVSGPEAGFIGAVPARLPEEIAGRIAGEALRLSTLFQTLGYFGRCSFDCLVTGSADGPGGIRWIECNGRWGGVSVPMTLANRLFGSHAGRGFVIIQNAELELAVNGTEAALERLGTLLLRRGESEGVAPLSAGGFERGAGLYLLAVAATQARAEDLAAEAVDRLAASRV